MNCAREVDCLKCQSIKTQPGDTFDTKTLMWQPRCHRHIRPLDRKLCVLAFRQVCRFHKIKKHRVCQNAAYLRHETPSSIKLANLYSIIEAFRLLAYTLDCDTRRNSAKLIHDLNCIQQVRLIYCPKSKNSLSESTVRQRDRALQLSLEADIHHHLDAGRA